MIWPQYLILTRMGAVRSGYQQPEGLHLSPDDKWAAWTMQEAHGIGLGTTWSVFAASEVDWPLDAVPPF